tara:strand:+ start:28 stop:633 length:606 start_codon:yes stop_codon:yes gene_type:complete
MEYTQDQFKFIQRKKPEFNLKPVPSLDGVVVEFLKKYEVYVQPPKNRNVAQGAITGAVTGLAGADVGGDMAIIQGQNKQTKLQEWTTWKQWALDHKDFEAYRAVKIDIPKSHNSKILESLKDPKVQKELEPLMKEFSEAQKKEEKETLNAIFLFFGVLLLVTGVAVLAPIFEDYLDNRKNNEALNKIYREYPEIKRLKIKQ